jgi:hypothetical protein
MHRRDDMADVLITYEILNELNGSLKQIIVEFEDATNLSEALEDAIGKPFDRDGLRNKARNFEERWDDRRNFLKQDLQEIQEHVEAVGSGWAEWDTEASKSLSVSDDTGN